MKHHQFKKIIKAIDTFSEERNSPRKAESLRELLTIADEYIIGTTNSPTEIKESEVVE